MRKKPTAELTHSHVVGDNTHDGSCTPMAATKEYPYFSYVSEIAFNHYPQFFTATILEWKHLLANNEMKDIVISSLQFLVNDGRVKVYGFVIMPNHLHIIWQIQDGHKKAKVQLSFLKYTTQQMKFALAKTGTNELEKYRVKASDREYQFWERNSLSIDLWSRQVFL